MIEFSEVTKSYSVGTHALRGINMQIEDGEFVFPVDFLRYYKTKDIGIPYEYEAYLKTILK